MFGTLLIDVKGLRIAEHARPETYLNAARFSLVKNASLIMCTLDNIPTTKSIEVTKASAYAPMMDRNIHHPSFFFLSEILSQKPTVTPFLSPPNTPPSIAAQTCPFLLFSYSGPGSKDAEASDWGLAVSLPPLSDNSQENCGKKMSI